MILENLIIVNYVSLRAPLMRDEAIFLSYVE